MTFKELDRKGKLEHIWIYYKLRIFMIGFLIIAGLSLIYTMFVKPHPDNYCGIAMYGQFLSMADDDALTGELNSLLELDARKNTVEIECFYSDETDIMVEAELNQKFNTYLYASQFNMIMADSEYTNTFIEAGYYVPLEKYIGAEAVKKYEDKGLILYGPDPETGNLVPIAVKLSDSALLKKYNLYQDKDSYVGFVVMPEEYRESTVKTFNLFLAE